jgi:DNA-binding transcriptional LysR family regulator
VHIETLKTFCDLVEAGSVTRAAELNRVTQSAVSQQLNMLEARYGRRLVERAPRTVARPTPAGRLLYAEAKQLLQRFEALERALAETSDVIGGEVRVATVYSVGLHVLPHAMKAFLKAHPAVNVRLEYRRTNHVYQACVDGEVDLGIVALPSRRPGLEVVPLRADELVLALPPGHALARKKSITLGDLDGERYVAFDRDIPTRKLLDRALRTAGATVEYAMELDNIETIKRSVEAGLGVSILPKAALQTEVRARTLVARKLAGRPFKRPIGVIRQRRRELSPAARKFLERLTRELGVEPRPNA